MARIIADAQFDLLAIDLNWYARNFFESGFEDNVNIVVDGTTYEDYYWVNGYDGFDDLELIFLGRGIAVNAQGAVTAGTVNLVAEYEYATETVWWLADGLSISAVALYNAALTASTDDELQLVVAAMAGNDTIILSDFADRISGFGGDDSITGGLGADWLEGGPGYDLFFDSMAGLNGDMLADFGVDDRIVFGDADLATFTFTLSGTTLNYGSGSLMLGTAPTGMFVARAALGGGVELMLQQGQGSASATSDFNGDGRSDLIVQSAGGAVSIWRGQANGSFDVRGDLAANALDASWRVVGIGDFNGDGRDDILWRHSSGVIGQWLGQGGPFANNSGVAANAVDNSWVVAGIADYNGDGRDDILWRHSSGEIGQWLAQANGSFSNNGGAAANLVDPSWTVIASGDVNGDGRADILWRHTSGVYAEWQGSATGKLSNSGAVLAGVSGTLVGSGDFNGDGRADVILRSASSGALSVQLGEASGQFTAVTPALQVADLNWKIVGIGDFNGDGVDDLLWKHASGVSAEWLGTGGGQFANNGAAPAIENGWAVQAPEVWLV